MLKANYTLVEAAKYLSEKSEEPISVQDVLELAGDDRLTLCANYNGDVCAFWKEFLGTRSLWAEDESFHVRGYFGLYDATDGQISRTSSSFCLSAYNPVKIKSLSLEGDDLLEVYNKSVDAMTKKQPTDEQIKRQANLKEMELADSDYQYFETVVDFGGFSSATGYPEITPVEVGLDDCLIRREDLDALLESCTKTGKMSLLFKCVLPIKALDIEEFPSRNLTQSNALTLNEIVNNKKRGEQGVTVPELNLHNWPLTRGDSDSLLNAINRPAKWLERAIVGNHPKLVNPATLAFAIQDKSKSSMIAVSGIAKQLGNHIAEHFPAFYSEYETLINYSKEA